MRPILLKTLKILALQGGTRHSVHISSTELAKKLEISQQSASRHIINLEKKGYIQKKYAQGGQIVNINDKGLETLRKEFTEYGLIFGTEKNVEMVGTLETGLGEGGYYISKEGYMKQFDKKLNWKPFKGTFNLRLSDDEVPKIEAMKAAEGILIEGFEEEGNIKRIQIYPKKSKAMNLAFDITPAKYVTSLITEKGICDASEDGLKKLFNK